MAHNDLPGRIHEEEGDPAWAREEADRRENELLLSIGEDLFSGKTPASIINELGGYEEAERKLGTRFVDEFLEGS